MSPQRESGCYFGGLRFEVINYASGIWMPPHTHRSAFLDLCLEGTIQDVWKETFVRGPATLNFIPAGASHGSYFPENVRTFQVVLFPSWMERIQQVCPLLEDLSSYSTGLPTWIAARMYQEFQRRDSVSPLALEGLLLELLAEMTRQSPPVAENDCPRWLREAKDYLHAHFTESLSMEEIAVIVGVHPSHLMRGFRLQYHCTIGDYVRRLRIEYACHLLSTSDAPAAQIARTVGFADQSHFTRAFKAHTGMTPITFQKLIGRASHRQEMQS